MLYEEYKSCAIKHLNACQALIESYQSSKNDNEALFDLYYLSGYILEGYTVYKAYQLYEWDRKKDIKGYDEEFTKESGIVFYRNDIHGNNGLLCVESHNFQAIKERLSSQFSAEFKNVPYFGEEIDTKTRTLIQRWKPKLRYDKHSHFLKENGFLIDVNALKKLFCTCNEILTFI